MSRIIIGIDPGKRGGLAVKHPGHDPGRAAMPPTPGDLVDLLAGWSRAGDCVCYLEKLTGVVGGKFMQGMFKFGEGYGVIQGALLALGIETHLVTPQAWQKRLGLGTRGDMTTTQWKNKLKAEAQRLFPGPVTLATADALLILRYAILEERE